MIIREALKFGAEKLKKGGVDASALEAGVLLCFVINRDKAFLYSHDDCELAENELQEFLSLIDQRAARMPLQYITGHQEFMSLDFSVSPDVLIPRQDTEILVETVIGWCKSCIPAADTHVPAVGMKHTKQGDIAERIDVQGNMAEKVCIQGNIPEKVCVQGYIPEKVYIQGNMPERIRILDIGTGSGCVAVSLAYYLENAGITAVDISQKALEIAYHNAVKAGVQNRIKFVRSDLFAGLASEPDADIDPVPGRQILFDAIVSNPPYIPSGDLDGLQAEVRCFEPMTALDGGGDGLCFYRRIIDEAAAFLKPGGLLAFEVGFDQAEAVSCLMRDRHFAVRTVRDLAGIERVVAGELL